MDVVEELLGLLKDQTAINDRLVGNDDKLVDKNISRSPSGSTFGKTQNPKLNNTEVRRTTEASSIFIKTYFDMERKMKPDKKEKTQTSQLYKRAEKARDRVTTVPQKGSTGWLDTLLAALGLGGLLKKLNPKFFKGLFTKILKGLGNMLKGLGKMISSFWKKITNSKILKSISRMIRSALKGIGRALSRIVSGFRSFFGALVKRLKGFWSSIKGSKIFKAVGRAIKGAIKAVASFFTGLKNKLLSLLNAAKEFAKGLIPKGAKEFVGKAASATGNAVKNVASKGGGFWESVKAVGSRAVGAVKSGASAVGSAVVETGSKAGKLAVQGAKAVGSFALGPAKEAISNASKGIIKGSGGMFKLMGKLAKLPVIGPIIEGLFTANDIKNLKEKHAKGEITIEELQAQSGRRVVQGVSALGGSALGTFLGAAAGSIIPVAGNIVGGVLGAIGGDMLGRFVGGLLNDYILPPKYSKSIGAFVTGTTPPANEMQDFIIKGNQVYPFSNKDEIMGMKNGGAIDNFLNSKQENTGLATLVNAANMGNMLLQGIEKNTRDMIKALGGQGGSTTVQQSVIAPPPSEKTMVTTGNNRSGYASSPYALA